MLSLKNRFHGHTSVRRVYRLGRPVRIGLASLHSLQHEKIRTTRVAVVVSRKVDKSAVNRNRIRRRIYEIIRVELPNIKTPTEIVITIYQVEAATITIEQLRSAIGELFHKARI